MKRNVLAGFLGGCFILGFFWVVGNLIEIGCRIFANKTILLGIIFAVIMLYISIKSINEMEVNR